MSFLSLKIFKNSQLLKTKIFTEDQISIGSSEGLSLQLEGISPWHVLIEKKQDIFCILDLNSEMGTKLNGESVTEESPLSSGSVITLGPYEIHFFIGPPVEDNKPAPSSSKDSKKAKVAVTSKKPAKKDSVESDVPSFEAPKKSLKPLSSVLSKKQKSSSQKTSGTQKTSDSSLQIDIPAKRPFKPSDKGFWNTYAPPSKIQNLDDFLEPSIGNLIEVIVCWKERVLSTHHFYEGGDVFMGSEKDCQISVPHMLGAGPYKLLSIASGAKIHLHRGVQGVLFQGQKKSTRTSQALQTGSHVILKPYEMVRLDFNDSLKVYVRLMNKPIKAPIAGLFKLRLSEALALFLSFLLTGLLIFYGSLYAPEFLAEDIKFIEKDLRIAKVVFKERKEPAKKVEYDLGERMKKQQALQKKPRLTKKTPSIKTLKRVKKAQRKKRPKTSPKIGKVGKMAGQAPGKKSNKRKVRVGSVRPGGSLKTGQKGSSAKTVAPDPTKVGLLGVFGGGGRLKELDKGATGSGGLVGLAEQATGYAGTEEAYEGEGIGTKTKDLGEGGKGSALVGISRIKTRGKGFHVAGTGSGGLGKRGQMSMDFGDEDIDVAGEIDRNAILQVIRRNQSKFQRCYQVSLNEKPSAQGNLSMEWFIATSGKGHRAQSVRNQLGSNYLANCVANVLNKLNFPAPPSGQIPKVRFTFRFYL